MSLSEPQAERVAETLWIAKRSKQRKPVLPDLGVRGVFQQVRHDLFGTKDVQDAITATYVWLEDQAGHIALGFALTLLPCWLVSLALSQDSGWRCPTLAAVAFVVFAVGFVKEARDRNDALRNSGGVFPFDSHDIDWNVATALFYYAVGIALGVSPFLASWLPLLVLGVAIYPILTVAYWWLRRKLAFQQAGLPYLYRLANFNWPMEESNVAAIGAFANAQNMVISLKEVLLGSNDGVVVEPRDRHILIIGSHSTGKTSLCVGIGTEFTFSMRSCRYLSSMKLVEQVLNGSTGRGVGPNAEFADGLNLWALAASDMVIVDDVDIGLATADGKLAAHLIHPERLVEALRKTGSATPLAWLKPKRSAWVIGDVAEVEGWRAAIADLIGIRADDVATIKLVPRPAS